MSEVMPDPQNSAAYRAAKLAVIILSSLIILALIALVVGGARQMSRKSVASRGTVAPATTAAYVLPAGAVIVAMETQPGRVILRLRREGADEIDILDMDSGRLVNRIRTAP